MNVITIDGELVWKTNPPCQFIETIKTMLAKKNGLGMALNLVT